MNKAGVGALVLAWTFPRGMTLGVRTYVWGCVAAIRAMFAKCQHRAQDPYCCGHCSIFVLGLLGAWSPDHHRCPRKGSPGPPKASHSIQKLPGVPSQQPHKEGRSTGGENEAHREKTSHPEVTGWQSGDSVCCRTDKGSTVGGSPRTGLALLRGVGSQVQPPQVVDLGLARCPGR